MSNYTEDAAQIVRDCGDDVKMGTANCKLWQEEHDDSCVGCPSELGCRKSVTIGLIVLEPCVDNPEGDASFETMERTSDRAIKVLNAKTLEEVNKLTDEFV